MEQTATVAESSGGKRRSGVGRFLIWDPRVGPGFVLAVIAIVIGFSCILPKAGRSITRLEEGVQTLQENQRGLQGSFNRLEENQRTLEQNQQRIIEKVDAIFEVVSER